MYARIGVCLRGDHGGASETIIISFWANFFFDSDSLLFPNDRFIREEAPPAIIMRLFINVMLILFHKLILHLLLKKM